VLTSILQSTPQNRVLLSYAQPSIGKLSWTPSLSIAANCGNCDLDSLIGCQAVSGNPLSIINCARKGAFLITILGTFHLCLAIDFCCPYANIDISLIPGQNFGLSGASVLIGPATCGYVRSCCALLMLLPETRFMTRQIQIVN
jgi:hypothetical protein